MFNIWGVRILDDLEALLGSVLRVPKLVGCGQRGEQPTTVCGEIRGELLNNPLRLVLLISERPLKKGEMILDCIIHSLFIAGGFAVKTGSGLILRRKRKPSCVRASGPRMSAKS